MTMKLLFGFGFAILSILSIAEAGPAPSPKPSHSPVAKKSPAEGPALLYFQAFQEGNPSKLKAAVTERFYKDVGESEWAGMIKENLPKYKSAKFSLVKPKVGKSDGIAGVGFGFNEGVEPVWVKVVREKSGAWKIDGILGDYDPEE